MKKVILGFAVMVLSAVAVFAQTEIDKNAVQAPVENKAETVQVNANNRSSATMHYWWNRGQLTNCMGNRWQDQDGDVKLRNGIWVTRKGELLYLSGKKVPLKDGECVDLNGNIMDHKTAHANPVQTDENKPDDKMQK